MPGEGQLILLFVFVVTVLIVFIVTMVGIGIVVRKITLRSRTASQSRLDDIYRRHVNAMLEEGVPDVSASSEDPGVQHRLAKVAASLKLELEGSSGRARRLRRNSLKNVMMSVAKDLVGESRVTLNGLFAYFDFTSEELRDLGDKRWWIRAKACRNVAVMHAADAITPLVGLLDDGEEDVRVEAAMALLALARTDALRPILKNLKNISVWMSLQLSKVVLSMGSAAAPDLIEALKSDYPTVRVFAVQILGTLRDISATEPLILLAKYSDSVTKCHALVALGLLGEASGLDVLDRSSLHEEEQVRISAAKGLGSIGSPKCAYLLKRMVLTDTANVRLAAGESLKKLPEGLAVLKDVYQSGDDLATRVALQFLDELGVARPASMPSRN